MMSFFFLSREVECSGSSSFGSYSGYFSTGKNSDMSNSVQENGILNELSKTVPMRLQLGGQFPYLPYNLNVLTDAKFQPPVELSAAENPLDYHINGNFEFPRPGDDTNQHSWASPTGPCVVSMFDKHLYTQVSLTVVISYLFKRKMLPVSFTYCKSET